MKNINKEINSYHLIKEMFETPDIIRNFKQDNCQQIYSKIKNLAVLMLTGEGSSRIFPAKNVSYHRMQSNNGPTIISESACDLLSSNLMEIAVVAASNSGRTKEVINLFSALYKNGHNHLYGLTCNKNSHMETFFQNVHLLETGAEKAVAATKSVVAQALFYDLLLSCWTLKETDLVKLADDFEKMLSTPADQEITEIIADADHVFFVGINNGVAEELTLKANEIIRKKSAFFPGTYLLHGVEEVVSEDDVIILVDEYPDHISKIKKIYWENIGAKVISFSDIKTDFPTVKYSCSDPYYSPYIKLAAGWKVLAEAGLHLGVNIDKPERARKIGNEFLQTGKAKIKVQ